MKEPCVVNKFTTEAEAICMARHWSKERKQTWTVVHGRGDNVNPITGNHLWYFAESGHGGMIRNDERLVGTWTNGREDDD